MELLEKEEDNADIISDCNNLEEEQFLNQLNLSKCNQSIKVNKPDLPRTRSKRKITKTKSLKSKLQESLKVSIPKRKVSLNSKIIQLKRANRDQLKSFNSRREKKTDAKTAKNTDTCTTLIPEENETQAGGDIAGFCRLCRHAYSSKRDRLEHFADTSHILLAEARKGTDFESLRKELELFLEVRYPAYCPICGKGPFKRRDFLVHHRRHTGIRPYLCVRCQNKYYRRCDLFRHIKTHLGIQYRFKCPECSSAFEKQSSLTSHLISKHKRPDNRSRNFKCTECNRSFMSKYDVHRHMKIHTGLTTARCDICGKSFASKTSLEIHKHQHSGATPFKCKLCPYSARSRQLLTRHERTHSGEKPFKCSQCSYVSSNSSGLKRHMNKHSGAKPFKCPYCDYKSSNIENLRKHIKSTRKHKGLNIYPCPHCSFSDDSSATFIRHVKQEHLPNLDEDTASATKLSGIFVSEDGAKLSSKSKSSNSDSTSSAVVAPQAYDNTTIEMIVDRDNTRSPSSDVSTSSTVTDVTNARPVADLDDELLNVLMKIPNLQQVILAPGDGNAPVTLVIGSDQAPANVEEQPHLLMMV